MALMARMPTGLRQRFHLQYTRHDGISGEMSNKKGSLNVTFLNSDNIAYPLIQ